MIEGEGHIDLFERYRNGEFSDSELKEFEARLAYDSEFKLEFEEYESIENGIKTHFRNELKSKLQEVDKKMDDTPKKAPIIRLAVWSSSVAAAIVIGIFIFQHFASPNTIEIAQEYWPHEEGLPVKMSTKGKYDDAMNAYKIEEFGKASQLLDTYETDTAYYFQGVIAYQKNHFVKASKYFSKVDGSSSYYDEAQFRLGLVYLSEEKTEQAKAIFHHIIDNKSNFSELSKEILKKI